MSAFDPFQTFRRRTAFELMRTFGDREALLPRGSATTSGEMNVPIFASIAVQEASRRRKKTSNSRSSGAAQEKGSPPSSKATSENNVGQHVESPSSKSASD